MNDHPLVQLTVQGYPVNLRGPAYTSRSMLGMQHLIAWRDENIGAPDAWLRQDICAAFRFMIGLNLGKPPAAEMMPITAETWVEVIGEGMTEELDRERIRAGFKQLRRGLKWWPQPEALLKVLPRRQTVGAGSPRPQEQPSDEQHASIAAKFEELINSFSSEMKVPNYEALDRQGIEKMKSEFIKKNPEEWK